MTEPRAPAGSDAPWTLQHRLVATLPDGASRMWELAGTLTIGRARDNDVVLRRPGVSRLHCIVKLVGDRACVVDQASTNGTYLNGERVAHGWLAHGDTIRVGEATFRVEVEGSRRESPPPESPPPVTPIPAGLRLPAPRRHLELVYRLGALLSSSVDEPTTARSVTGLALQELPLERVFVLAIDGEAGEPRVLASALREGAAPVPGGPSRTAVELTLSRGEAIHSFDVASEEQLSKSRSLAKAQARTVLAAPLRLGEQVLGVLYGDAPQAAESPDLEGALDLFRGIADQAALALGRARLHGELLASNEALRHQRDRLDELNRQLDARVREKTALAEAQASELAARLAELEHLQKARESMARAIVHDIRNLVGSVSANLSFVRSFVDGNAEAAEATDDALAGSDRIVELAEDVLAVSRIEAGAMTLLLQSVVVAQLLDAAARRHGGRARELGVELRFDAGEPGLVVTADSKLLARVLDNLIGNALRYAGRGGAVSLSVSRSLRSIDVVVSDTGPGIPPASRERIFAEWHSDGDSKGRHHGIGLYFCRLAVEAHGGEIRVEGESGDNRLVVSLPARREDDDVESTITDRPTLVKV